MDLPVYIQHIQENQGNLG